MHTSLENTLSAYFNRKYCLLVGSGTTAIYCIFRALKLQEGAKVLYPDITCETAINAAIYAGLQPVFCDIDLNTFNLDFQGVSERISQEKIAAIVPTHMFGNLLDIPKLQRMIEGSQIPVIEDAAQGYGGFLNEQKAGQMGNASIVSFGPGKLLDCGGGGAVLTDSEQLAVECSKIVATLKNSENARKNARIDFMKEMFLLQKNSGNDRDFWKKRDQIKQSYRSGYLSSIEPQIVNSLWQSFSRLDEIVRARRLLTTQLTKVLSDCSGVQLPKILGNPVFWRYSVLLEKGRDGIFDTLTEKHITVSRLFPPLHREYGLSDANFPNAVTFYERVLNIVLETSTINVNVIKKSLEGMMYA